MNHLIAQWRAALAACLFLFACLSIDANAKGPTKMRKRTDFIVIHCSATPPSMNIGAREIDRWHRAKGYFRIGYHFVIRRDGSVEHGRDVNAIGAHARGVNDRSIGIVLVGGVAEDKKTPEDNFTPEQWATLEQLVGELEGEFPKAEIIGHRDVDKHRACPSFDVHVWNAKRKGEPVEKAKRGKRKKHKKPLVYSVLRKGARGPLVHTLQAKLNRFLDVPVSGFFGPETEQAVKAFQQDHRLIADGIVGPRTWSALLRYE